MSLSQQEKKEKEALTKLVAIEDQLVTLTATVLSEEIAARITQSDVVPISSQEQYAVVYSAGMHFAWLYGHWHVQQLINDSVELAEVPEKIPFKEALAYLESQVPMTSRAYQELDANMKLRSFTVAGVSSEQSAATVQGLYTKALASGQSSSETMQQVGQFLEQAGVSPANPWYLDLHYRNNMMSAYNAGRWAQIEGNELVEQLIYLSVMDDGTTKLCRHLDRMVKPKGDAMWQRYWPPNHHKCRATVSPLGQSQYEQIPDEVKQRSAQINDDRVEDDPAMAAEHQFTSSPTQALKRLPDSLMQQAKAFELEPAITIYSVEQSNTLLATRLSELRQSVIPSSVITQAGLTAKQAEQAGDLVDSEEVAFGIGQVEEDWQGEIWFFEPSEDGWLWGRAAAYDSLQDIANIAWITAAHYEALVVSSQSL